MKFIELSSFLERLEATSSRNRMTEILADLFKKIDVNDADKTVNLILGQLAPNYRGIIFNIADRMMMRAIAKAYAKDAESVTKLYKQKGDLGIVAQELAEGSGKDISVAEVYEKLLKIAQEHGEDSQERKVAGLAEVLSLLDPLSARYVIRIPLGKLRLGFSDKTVLDALSWMERKDKSGKKMLEKAYEVLPDVGLLARQVKLKGIEKAAKNITPVVGIPVLPMLAQRLKSPKEMIEKMGRVAVEPKFDGLRISIHYKRNGFSKPKVEGIVPGPDDVKAFTRNMNETSWMFPELSKAGASLKADEVILDSEAVGVDETRKTFANFQQTMTRRRKHEIEKISTQIPIKFYVFDIIYKDGKGLTELDYLGRRAVLETTVKSGSLFEVVDYQLTDKAEEIGIQNTQKRKQGFEGIIIKKLESGYVPGRTGWRWVKMKEAEEAIGKLADTVDCVVMGYTAGRGKRVTFGLGQFLVGVREGEDIKTVTKVGTGLTDIQFKELEKRLSGLVVDKKPKNYIVNKALEPDFWVIPEVVVEIAADEITKSPNHTAGLALRFPRLVKFRDDRDPADATTVKEVKKLYEMQKV